MRKSKAFRMSPDSYHEAVTWVSRRSLQIMAERKDPVDDGTKLLRATEEAAAEYLTKFGMPVKGRIH